MLFLALLALDRAGKREGARWGALAVVLIGIMPAYEAYHAMAACLGLVLWWTAALLQLLRRGQKRGSPSLPEQPGEGCAPNRAGRFFRTDLGFRTGVTFASGLLALLVIQVLYLGMRTGSPVVFRIENSYRESYKHEWFNAARGNDAFSARVKTLLLWKRGELPDPAERARLGNPRPSHLQHIAGTIVYEFGFVIYFLLRFVNVAIFGILALALSAWRRESWSPSRSLIAAIALVGFAMPCVVIWGHMGGGKWWGTPDIYRLTGCGHLLLMLEGLGLLCIALRQAWRPRWWLPLGLAGYQAWVLVAAVLEPVTGYHHVSYDRLGALAYLRQHVRFGEVVIHPWIDDLIYDSRDPHRAPWIYKRHFNLVSNMTGQMMYYEGREDAMFVGAPPEAVYRRSNLRQAFYQQPDAATLAAVLEEQPIRWVVADGEHRAPPAVCAGWEIVYRNATVRIYRR